MSSKFRVKTRLVNQNKSTSIVSLFFEEFEDVFTHVEPGWEEIRLVFEWLREEAQDARYFSDINAIDKCRRISEAHFSKFVNLKSEVCSESRRVNRELRKRFDELRITKRSGKSRFLSLLTYEHEHDKTPPPC